MNIPVADITIPARKRPLNPAKVEQLVESIQEIGLLNPITLTPDYVLISGLHRLEAVRQLGHRAIAAEIRTLNVLQQELAEIDENLMRGELSTLERGEQYARRKEIYESLHPETKAGAAQGEGKRNQLAEIISASPPAVAKAAARSRCFRMVPFSVDGSTEVISSSVP